MDKELKETPLDEQEAKDETDEPTYAELIWLEEVEVDNQLNKGDIKCN